MVFRIPERIRVAVSKKYLDIAEMLPNCEAGPISHLQTIRRYQRKYSGEAFEKSIPPEGAELEFLYFRLIEIFHVHDFKRLNSGIRKLFPQLEDEYRHGQLLDTFSRSMGDLFGGYWIPIGTVSPEASHAFYFPWPVQTLSNLPPVIDKIKITVHKLLPSVLTLTLDVCLKQEFSHELSAAQRRHYLPTVRLTNLIPWRIGGYSQTRADWEASAAILNKIDSVRALVEESIRLYIDGYFMHRNWDKRPRLPAIEVFSLRESQEAEIPFNDWRTRNSSWLSSFGFDLNFHTYKSEGLVFSSSTEAYTKKTTPRYRLLICEQPFLRAVNASGFATKREALIYHTRDTLDGLLPLVQMFETLKTIRSDAEELRQIAYHELRERFRWRRAVKVAVNVEKEAMLLERMLCEFQESKDRILKRGDLPEFRDASLWVKNDAGLLLDEALAGIEKFSAQLRTQLSLVGNWTSRMLAVRNMDLLYRLQSRIFWLTIIVTIATIVGILLTLKRG